MFALIADTHALLLLTVHKKEPNLIFAVVVHGKFSWKDTHVTFIDIYLIMLGN